MWIIPSTISASAPGMQASTLDCEEFSRLAEQSLMWRSKPSPSPTWSRRWRKVSWIRLLSGRICTPSRSRIFEDWWTSSAEGSPVSRFPKLVRDWELKTHVICGLESSKESEDVAPLLFSSRTWTALQQQHRRAMNQFSTMSSATWRDWITERRQTSSQRKNSVRHTSENGGSSSEWPTPTSRDVKGISGSGRQEKKGNPADTLPNAVSMWPTPTAHEHVDQTTSWETLAQMDKGGRILRRIASLHQKGLLSPTWPTPTVAEGDKIPNTANNGQVGLSNHPAIQGECTREPMKKSRAGQLRPDLSNTRGRSRGQLNPAWVEQLMGLPPSWTQLSTAWNDSECLGTESSQTKPPEPSQP